MNTLNWLAQSEVQEVLQSVTSLSSSARDRLIIFGAVLLVAILAFVWVGMFRKPRRRHSRHHHHHHHHHRPQPESRPSEDTSLFRKRRRRRREHRPRNPTLAETGGLPPRRPDDVPPTGP